MTTTAHVDLLREAGLRVTAPRLAVLAEVAGAPHADADTVRARVRERLGSVSTQVYDVLHALTEVGLLRRIGPAGSPGRYELARADNHHHLVGFPGQDAPGPRVRLRRRPAPASARTTPSSRSTSRSSRRTPGPSTAT